MDETTRHHKENPVLKANFLSKIFFCWINPLFKTGLKRSLEVEDMYDVVPEDASSKLGDDLEREWEKEIQKSKTMDNYQPSLVKALFRTFGVPYMLLGLIVFIEEGTKVVQPLLLGALLRYFTPTPTISMRDAYLFALGVSLCAASLAISHHPYFFNVCRIGMKMRIACCSLMYKKSLKLSNKALGQTTTGQIVNLMSNDVNRFDQAVIFLHFLWVGPLQAIAVLVILWHELGPAVLAGFAVLLLLIPMQACMGKLFSKLRHKTAIHTDERVRLMNEIISGMRVIKMYCWEKPFGDLVEKVRKMEVAAIQRARNVQALILGPFFVSSKLVIYLIVLAVTFTGRALGVEKLYVVLGVVQAIRLSMTLFVPFAVQSISEIKVCLRRFEKFLLLEELDSLPPSGNTELRPKPSDCFVSLENVTAKWDENVDQNTLENINACVKAGKLLAVIGPVGAGKSSLLMAVLGELPLKTGRVQCRGKVAYVAQQAWVFSASLRQNILFGNPYIKAKYERVLKACALNRDISIMPHGDATLVGDRGVSLSGGQRARVSLARAMYTDADIYLLDDPLSAVDTAVGQHLFMNCIERELANKPRILVTHQLQYLQDADQILILKEGKVLGMGTFNELARSGVDFSTLLKVGEEEEEQMKPAHSLEGLHTSMAGPNEIGSTLSLVSIKTEFEPEAVQLPQEEVRQEGNVGLGVYFHYFKAGAGILLFLLLVFINLAAQTAYVMSDWWLSRWSNEEEKKYAAIEKHEALLESGFNMTNVTIPTVDTITNVSIFSGIIGAVFLFGLLRALLFFRVAINASQILHNRMFTRILRTPISFFDTNPVGRILNRFSKDVGHMDDLLPITFFDFVQCSLLILGIVIVAGVVNPWVFLPTVPICVFFILVRKYYLSTSRSVKRLEGTTRSPVFSHLSASLQGLSTIRAFGMQRRFIQEFDSHQDLHTQSWFLFLCTSRWFAVRLDWLCTLFISAVTFSAIPMVGSLDAGLVGLSITYAMTLMGLFQWGVRQSAEVENQMISVERVLEYTRLPQEAEFESPPDRKPPPAWPHSGAISGRDVCLKYASDGPQILKSINFDIRGQEKVGIVGRTGAGKSSLIAALFRLVEPEGKLLIDNLNTGDLGLHDLRRTISIIPQDPVLFTGTLRRNLDPFQQHGDAGLWQALGEVQLKGAVEELPGGLDTAVSEGGINFSVGQRQLICLARAILRQNRILLIDEATANVDPKTDALIQETIRDKFKTCTVLTIAHRLNTIMDSDRVLVLDEGNLMEFDTPHRLLCRGQGYFYDMVQQTGHAEAEALAEIARAAHLRRSSTDLPPAEMNGGPTLVPKPKFDMSGDRAEAEETVAEEETTGKKKLEELEENETEKKTDEEKREEEEEEEEGEAEESPLLGKSEQEGEEEEAVQGERREKEKLEEKEDQEKKKEEQKEEKTKEEEEEEVAAGEESPLLGEAGAAEVSLEDVKLDPSSTAQEPSSSSSDQHPGN